MRTLGIIGGSGLNQLEGLTDAQEVVVETPFGKPSGPYVIGQLFDTRLVFLARHGLGHSISPTHINYRANIHGMKQLGVEHLIAFSAVGSLKEKYPPQSFVLPDQFIDLTKHRTSSFFDANVVAHVGFAEPTCSHMRTCVWRAAKDSGLWSQAVDSATLVVMEGPQFSTVAESNIYRSWGADLIGMTAMPEAKLAREAEMCYALVAMVTDYDCWHGTYVDATEVVKVMQANVLCAKAIIKNLAQAHVTFKCGDCHNALKGAIMSDISHPLGLELRYQMLLSKYNRKYGG